MPGATYIGFGLCSYCWLHRYQNYLMGLRLSNSRVTSLDEFSPVGNLFTWEVFFITQVAHIFGLLLSKVMP
jgi:hypothetical protein